MTTLLPHPTDARTPPRLPAPLLVVGGAQRKPRSMRELDERWYGYGEGVALGVQPDGCVERVMTYVSPPDARAEGDPVLFKCATYRRGLLYACTETEVLLIAVPGFEVLERVSLPCFNDVHHVLPTADDTVLVASSGLELVAEVTWSGEVRNLWNVLGEGPWDHFDPDVDYRFGHDLKPHRAHPNHLFAVGDEVFATRFERRDAISLRDPSRRIDIGRERIHDGVVHGDHIFFTSVDGCVHVVDRERLTVDEVIELRPPDGDADALLGWCRGLSVDDDHVWVGFSRIRQTRFRQTLSWVRTSAARSCPTRIARYRRRDWTCELEIDLEPHGLNAVFTVTPCGELATRSGATVVADLTAPLTDALQGSPHP